MTRNREACTPLLRVKGVAPGDKLLGKLQDGWRMEEKSFEFLVLSFELGRQMIEDGRQKAEDGQGENIEYPPLCKRFVELPKIK
jgi:hypothetical protein